MGKKTSTKVIRKLELEITKKLRTFTLDDIGGRFNMMELERAMRKMRTGESCTLGYTHSFLGGCLRVAGAGALGDLPDASKRHQGPGGPYTRHSKECRDDMPGGLQSAPGVAGLGTS